MAPAAALPAPPGKGKASAALDKANAWVQENGKTVLLWGWIPAVIALGMLTTKPRPSVLSLIWFG